MEIWINRCEHVRVGVAEQTTAWCQSLLSAGQKSNRNMRSWALDRHQYCSVWTPLADSQAVLVDWLMMKAPWDEGVWRWEESPVTLVRWGHLSSFHDFELNIFFGFVQPPTGLSPKATSGRDLSCHSSYGSLPREVGDQTESQSPIRTERSPIHSYNSIEVTNVWERCDQRATPDLSFVAAMSAFNNFRLLYLCYF